MGGPSLRQGACAAAVLVASPYSAWPRRRFRDFRLQSGVVLPEITIAYHSLGTLAPDRRNAVLVLHGYTGGPGLIDARIPGDGAWAGIVGPGKPFDSDRFFILAPSMLGSCFGSTGPASTDPATGRPYGLGFPDLTIVDLVNAQRLLLDALGIERLVAITGPSQGGFQVFQWAVQFPDAAAGIVPVVTIPFAPRLDVDATLDELARDPNWRGGDYYGGPPPREALRRIRARTLRDYGYEWVLMRTLADPAARAAAIERLAAEWADHYDANCLVVLRKANAGFDAQPHFARIKARVLYVLSRTDPMFRPAFGPRVVARLKRAGVAAEYVEVDSEARHYGAAVDIDKWAPRLRAFIAALADRAG